MELLIFGGLLLDRYFSVDRWPQRGQDGYFTAEERFVGGCAVNMAMTARNLGAEPMVVSCVGSDDTGAEILAYLRRRGLSGRCVMQTEGASGSCLVFSEPDGERTFLTRKGAEEQYPAALDAAVAELRPAAIGVTGYYLLGRDGPRILERLEAFHRVGVPVLFDPSPLVGDVAPELLLRMLAVCDVMTPNTVELKLLGGAGLLEAMPRAGKTVLLKRGAEGGTVCAPSGRFDYGAVPCPAVDTTGAGDSFSGALLYGMAAGLPLEETVGLAARCAAKTVQLRGPHGVWSKEDIQWKTERTAP